MSNRFFKRILGLFSSDTAELNTSQEQPKQQSQPSDKTAEVTADTPRVISEAEHQIPRKFLDDNASKVVYRLSDAGYESYLVGGCIRDLLLKQRPKDFDVATNADPEAAHQLFKRSRLIGRRFKLLHVRFGRELIEVATFRASHDSQENQDASKGKQSNKGLILRDNVYGSIEEDALRRDFTINALYYSLKDHAIYDYANGYQDIKSRNIRMIGDPASRYREDPVRMLRAIRFAAKLNFDIEADTAAPIRELAPLLKDIASARLFDELLKLFQSGHAVSAYYMLKDYNLLPQLLPQVTEHSCDLSEKLIINGLKNTDKRIRKRKSITPAFLFATLLWHPLQARMQKVAAQNRKMPPLAVLHTAANEVLAEQVRRTAIPRRFSTTIREIWELQLRLPKRRGTRAYQLLEHPRFRAAYDLLLLRETSGENLESLGLWWTEFQTASDEVREEMVKAIPHSQKPASRKPKAKKTSAKKVEDKRQDANSLETNNKEAVAEAKASTDRRRRRRRAKNDPREQKA